MGEDCSERTKVVLPRTPLLEKSLLCESASPEPSSFNIQRSPGIACETITTSETQRLNKTATNTPRATKATPANGQVRAKPILHSSPKLLSMNAGEEAAASC